MRLQAFAARFSLPQEFRFDKLETKTHSYEIARGDEKIHRDSSAYRERWRESDGRGSGDDSWCVMHARISTPPEPLTPPGASKIGLKRKGALGRADTLR